MLCTTRVRLVAVSNRPPFARHWHAGPSIKETAVPNQKYLLIEKSVSGAKQVGRRRRFLPVPRRSWHRRRALLWASFSTDPNEIADLDALLERTTPSPLPTLHRAIAVGEWQGPEAGLAVLEGLAPPDWLSGCYLWDAVLAALHRRARHVQIAQQHRERALGSAPTDAVRELLRRRLGTAS
jgi:predicted RNA polymerase sigma factor